MEACTAKGLSAVSIGENFQIVVKKLIEHYEPPESRTFEQIERCREAMLSRISSGAVVEVVVIVIFGSG